MEDNHKIRREKALKHYRLMSMKYNEETDESIKGSQVLERKDVKDFESNFQEKCFTIPGRPLIVIPQKTIGEALKSLSNVLDEKTSCVLNFASYTRAGGGFLGGSMAQEEALCHDSNLYNVLEHFTEMYDENYQRDDARTGMYRDWAIYSPKVLFFPNENEIKLNVLTCPAPNLRKYNNSIPNEYHEVIYNRIKFILDIAEENKQKTLFLGAFGCGVFKNNPIKIATIMKDLLSSGIYHFERVYFPIPDEQNMNAFIAVFQTTDVTGKY